MVDLKVLGERAVACKGWRWMPGMLTTENARVLLYDDSTGNLHAHAPCGLGEEMLPDFSDPATRGCLLVLVREAWGDPTMYASEHSPGRRPWRVWRPGDPIAYGDTEAEALVRALAVAP